MYFVQMIKHAVQSQCSDTATYANASATFCAPRWIPEKLEINVHYKSNLKTTNQASDLRNYATPLDKTSSES